MVTQRFEMRLDDSRRDNLAYVAEHEGESITQAARRLLDRGFEEWMRERRRLAVERLAAMEIEEMPEPDELSRQLASTYDVDLP